MCIYLVCLLCHCLATSLSFTCKYWQIARAFRDVVKKMFSGNNFAVIRHIEVVCLKAGESGRRQMGRNLLVPISQCLRSEQVRQAVAVL